MNKELTIEDMYSLCNQYQWFTQGTRTQYDKLFKMVKEKAPLEDLALVIWVCTSNTDRETILKVLKKNAS